jgi:peroxiredoxin Q/BCP
MPLVSVGDAAPAFTLPDHTGAVRTLREFLGRPLVLFLYPEANTELCTKQACALSAALPTLTGPLGGARVVGISPDGPEKLAAFIRDAGLKVTLLGDVPDKKGVPRTMAAYGAWGEKNMYGNVVQGTLRTTYLIDPAGRVAKVWPRVKVPGHAERVAAAVAGLGAGAAVEGAAGRPGKRKA